VSSGSWGLDGEEGGTGWENLIGSLSRVEVHPPVPLGLGKGVVARGRIVTIHPKTSRGAP